MLQEQRSPFAGGAGAVAEDVAQVRAGAGVDNLDARHEGDAAVRHLNDVLGIDRLVEARPAWRRLNNSSAAFPTSQRNSTGSIITAGTTLHDRSLAQLGRAG